jgi:hypothetical protein
VRWQIPSPARAPLDGAGALEVMLEDGPRLIFAYPHQAIAVAGDSGARVWSREYE